MLTANVIIAVDIGNYNLVATFNGIESTMAEVTISQNNAVATLNIFESLKWSKGTIIELKIKSNNGQTVKVLQSSSWSIGFIGEASTAYKEFSSFLSANQSIPAATSFQAYHFMQVDLSKVQSNLATPGYKGKGQFISPNNTVMDDNTRFSISDTALYYVSLIIHFDGEAEEIEAILAVSAVENGVRSKYGISGRFDKIKSKECSITLSGVFLIKESQYVSAFVTAIDKKAFSITTHSFMSVIKMRYIVSSVSSRISSTVAKTTTNWVDIHSKWLTEKTGLYSFGKDFSSANGKFTSSHSGVHSVHANIQFSLSGSDATTIHAAMLIDGLHDEENGFYSVMKNPKEFATLKIYGAVNLRAGQTLEFKVKSDTVVVSYSITERTSISVSYIGPTWAVPSFFAMPQSSITYNSTFTVPTPFNGWDTVSEKTPTTFSSNAFFDKTHYTSNEDGIYVISAHMILSNIMCSAGMFLMEAVTTGSAISVDVSIGIQDRRFTSASNSEVNLAFATALRLESGKKVGIKLTSLIPCTYTISSKSSFSLVKWSGYTNPSYNLEKYVGILARTNAITNYPTNDKQWKQLGQSILSHAVGNSAPLMTGMFLAGEGFDSGNSDFNIKEPGIFFVSGSLNIQHSILDLNGQYEINVQIDKKDDTYGLYSTVTKQNSRFITLTFGGTIYLTTSQRVRVAFKGSDDSFFLAPESTFSLIKLQPDYKTPGIVTERTLTTISAANAATYNIPGWNAHDKMGLVVR